MAEEEKLKCVLILKSASGMMVKVFESYPNCSAHIGGEKE